MARMLQALKNLEARSAKPVARQGAAARTGVTSLPGEAALEAAEQLLALDQTEERDSTAALHRPVRKSTTALLLDSPLPVPDAPATQAQTVTIATPPGNAAKFIVKTGVAAATTALESVVEEPTPKSAAQPSEAVAVAVDKSDDIDPPAINIELPPESQSAVVLQPYETKWELPPVDEAFFVSSSAPVFHANAGLPRWENLVSPPVEIPLPSGEPTPLLIATQRPSPTPPRSPARAVRTIEALIRRTLTDPIRSQPLVELAERLQRDIQQTRASSLVLVGLGSQSETRDTALFAATLLAGETQEVLLVDANLARQPLSEALESATERGLAELIRDGGALRDFCQPTATDRLTFLPAGQLRHFDLSAAGPKLEKTLERLAAEFSLVIIDAGRSCDLAATALARQADATYFIVQLGQVETNEAQEALRDFRAAGARLLGCIAT